MKQVKILKIVVASPGDVQAERDMIPAIVDELNKGIADERGVRLEVYRWETDAYPGFHPEGPQGQIDSCLRIDDCDLLIGIFWKRFGTPVLDANSGTEHEIQLALAACEKMGRPQLMIYFNQIPHQPQAQAEKEQWQQILDFKQSLSQKVLWWQYHGKDQFKDFLRRHLTQFIRDQSAIKAIRPSSSSRCEFYSAIYLQLPPNYVPREELLAELRMALLYGTDPLALTSVKAKPTALHGMGGIGKSVMARALCEDPQVRDAFPHGILWTTLGQEPNLAEKLREWIHALGGAISETVPTLDQLKNNLNKLLDGRQCLLVVDDVWRKQHAEAFRVGNQCRLLLTTRDTEIAAELGATVQPVPLMTRDEAIRLLEEWAEGNLRTIALSLKERIVERLGRLPLALRLAGAQLRHRDPENWLASFDVLKLKAKRIEGMHDSLAKTFEWSLEALGETRPLYTALAIFKEDEAIPEPALHKLWNGLANFDATQTTELLEDLASRALLTLDSKITPRRASLHDLLRDLIGGMLNDESCRHMHACLLEAYRITCKGTGWHTAPDDGYLYDHLVYHLENTQQWDELHALFKNQDWMNVRVPQRDYDYDGYLSDVMAGWEQARKRAQTQIAAHEMPAALADCMRYALIRTSINSLATNYEPALVARAVETGLWSVQRALSLAAKVPDPKQRAQFYITLLATIRLDQDSRVLAQQQALAVAGELEFEWERAEVLAILLPQLMDEKREQVISDELVAARAIDYKPYRGEVLSLLASQLQGKEREQVLREGLSVVQAIDSDKLCAEVLTKLAPMLTGDNLREGLKIARAIKNKDCREEVLVVLVLQLLGENLHEGLEVTRAIKNENLRVKALVTLAPLLTKEERDDVLREELLVLWTIDDKLNRAEALAALIPILTGEERKHVFRECLSFLRTIEETEWYPSQVPITLAGLIPILTEEEREHVFRECLALLRTTENEEWYCSQVLIALAHHLMGESLCDGLTIALTIKDEQYLAQILMVMGPYLASENLSKGLEAVREIKDRRVRGQVLAILTQQLGDEEQKQALREELIGAQMIEDGGHCAKALALLALQLADEERDEALREGLVAVRAIKDELDFASALAALAPQLRGEEHEMVLNECMVAVWELKDKETRVLLLAELAEQLTGVKREQVLNEGLKIVREIEYQKDRANALVRLAPMLVGENLRKELATAQAIDDKEYKAKILAALASNLTGIEREQVLHDGFRATLMIKNKETRARVLAKLIPQLAEDERKDALLYALLVARSIEDEWSCAMTLAKLVPQFTGEEREKVLHEGLAAARVINHDWRRAEVLVELVPNLIGREREQVLYDGLDAARKITNEIFRSYVITELTPLLQHEQAYIKILEFIECLLNKKRSEILALCIFKKLFSPPLFSRELLAAITRHIIEICQKWQWF